MLLSGDIVIRTSVRVKRKARARGTAVVVEKERVAAIGAHLCPLHLFMTGGGRGSLDPWTGLHRLVRATAIPDALRLAKHADTRADHGNTTWQEH